MSRIEFPLSTKKIAAERAGYRCSYPGCYKPTTGPAEDLQDVARAAIACHIFSASEGGPRGSGGLGNDDLKNPANCIWMCPIHGTLIDKNDGNDYPAAVLLSFKQLHESRISKELKGICSITGWVHEIDVTASLLFAPVSKLRFGKLTLLYGENASGKSTLCALLSGFFQATKLEPYVKTALGKELDVRLNYYQPNEIVLRMTWRDHASFRIDGVPVSWNPLPLKILEVSKIDWSLAEYDQCSFFSRTLSLEDWQVLNLAKEVNEFPKAHIRNVRFVVKDGVRELKLNFMSDHHEADLNMLSRAEAEIVLMEFATAAARLSARYCPTFLILDYPFSKLANWYELFEPQLLDPVNQFQTIMTVPLDFDLANAYWSGWNVIKLDRQFGSNQQTVISELPKPARSIGK